MINNTPIYEKACLIRNGVIELKTSALHFNIFRSSSSTPQNEMIECSDPNVFRSVKTLQWKAAPSLETKIPFNQKWQYRSFSIQSSILIFENLFILL